MAVKTPLARMREIQIDWAIGDVEKLARLLHASPEHVAQWLATPAAQDDGQVPIGLEGAWRLLKIRDCLTLKIPEAAKQVDWLFAARKDWEGARPIDLMGASLEELSWVAYWLESVTSQPASEAPAAAPAP